VDGTSRISYGGGVLDTTAGLENISTVGFGWVSGSHLGGYDSQGDYDDIVLDSADWIGNTAIGGLAITGAGASAQWTPSAGDNYACVDEIPYNDTDYNNTNTTNNKDTYALASFVTPTTEIKCIQASGRISYNGSPTPTKQELILRCGGTDYSHATQITPSSIFSCVDRIWEEDPDDPGNPFTPATMPTEMGVMAVA